MTCIVGIADKGRVWLGADSAAHAGDLLTVRSDSKIIKVDDELLIGFAGSYRVAQILQYRTKFATRPKGQELFAYMVEVVAERIKAACIEAADDGTFQALVGGEGRLFKVDTDFHVGEPYFGFDAIGAGAPYALGALITSRWTTPGTTPEQRVSDALSAALEFSPTVRGPLNVLATGCEIPDCADSNARIAT